MKSLTEVITQISNYPMQIESGINLKTFNKEELLIFQALDSLSIKKSSKLEVKEHLKTCLALSGTQIPTQEIFEFCVNFVIESYSQYKVKELNIAFKMYAEGKLSVDNYITFSPKLIGEIMCEYKKIAIQVRQRIKPEEVVVVPELSNEEIISFTQKEWLESARNDFNRVFNADKVFAILLKQGKLEFKPSEMVQIIKAVRLDNQYRLNKMYGQDAKAFNQLIKDENYLDTQCKKLALKRYFESLPS
jgi:hypothetical protein